MAKPNFDDNISAYLDNSSESTAEKIAAKKPVEPTTPDEEQDLERSTEVTVIANGKSHYIGEVDGEIAIVSKGDGRGIYINDDIQLLPGPKGANGKFCAGRFLVNARGGSMQKYGGPRIVTATQSSTSAANGEGSKEKKSDSSESGKNDVANSECYYGDDIKEVHGEIRIKGTNIVIEAADVLTLMGKNSVHIQAGPSGGGEIKLAAGQISETTDTRITQVTGQKQDVISEELSLQYDPRASVNVISPGHMNVKAAGDIALGCAGAFEIIALGKKPLMGLIKDPVSTIGMKTVAGGLTLTSASFTNITAVGALTQTAAATTVTAAAYLLTAADITATALTGGVNVEATLGDIELEAKAGDVKVKGKLIYLN